jgi:hypothetical protein
MNAAASHQLARIRHSLVIAALGAAILVSLCIVAVLTLNASAVQSLSVANSPWERSALLESEAVLFGSAVVSSALLSGVLWWRIVVRPQDPGIVRGVVAGLHSGLLIHPLTWFLGFLSLMLVYGAQINQLGKGALIGLLYGIPLSISYTGLGLAAGGWITIAVGALAGGLLGFALRRPRQRTSGVALTA